MHGTSTVLLVGNESADALAGGLARAGAIVRRASDPAEAIAGLTAASEPVRLVIVDLRVPGLKAWGFLREKGRCPDTAAIPTVLVTAAAVDGVGLDPLAAGVVGHVDANASADVILRFADARAPRRATDRPLLRAWYRSDLLAELSEALGHALELETLLERVAKLLTSGFADFCVIQRHATTDSTAAIARVHYDGAAAAPLDALDLGPIMETIGAGPLKSLRLDAEHVRSLLATRGARSEQVAIWESIGARALLALPMVSRGSSLGAIVCGRLVGDFDRVDVELAEEIAHRLAMSVDMAVHHALVQQAARAREDLLAIVSHDLRIPLTTISMIATKIKRTSTLSETTHRDAETIMRNLRRMERLIRDLLDSSRLETGRLRVDIGRSNVGQLLGLAVETARPLLGNRSIELAAPAPDDSPWVLCDRERVLQILDNLIGNALKFTPEHGTVTVRLETRACDVKVSVTDTGCGIDAEHLPHLFDRYWQARSGDPYDARRGVGLGLFITKGLVEAQHGAVSVESTVGQGSVFSFTLPLDASESIVSSRGVRPVVVIDDDLALRREVCHVLRHEGYEVVSFAHARAALEYLQTHPTPALILTDLMMPVMDGWELGVALAGERQLEGVPVVVLSGAEEAEGDATSPLLARCAARIKKPASPEEIVRIVASHCTPSPSGAHRVGERVQPLELS